MVKVFRMTLCYDGSAFHGFQVQKNAVSVCQVFQDAVEVVCGSRGQVKGCSRTDTGVHALGYVLCLYVETKLDAFRLMGSLNGVLPLTMSVLQCSQETDPTFHPRYDVVEKEYIYKIYNHTARNPFHEGRALHYPRPLQLDLLNKGCRLYEGTHDFSAFCSGKSDMEDKVRSITYCRMEREGDMVLFTVRGDGFLYNMVRIMVGTLLWLNEGRITLSDLKNILDSGDRQRAGITAPAHGLYLNRVIY